MAYLNYPNNMPVCLATGAKDVQSRTDHCRTRSQKMMFAQSRKNTTQPMVTMLTDLIHLVDSGFRFKHHYMPQTLLKITLMVKSPQNIIGKIKQNMLKLMMGIDL